MKKIIAVLPGDGIGPEVMESALRILLAIGERYGHVWEIQEKKVGGAAFDLYGVPLPDETLGACEGSDAILFGSVGGPKWDHLPAEQRPEGGALLRLRKHFDLFANIRPVEVLPHLFDFSPLHPRVLQGGFSLVVVRELTGDVYFGEKRMGPDFGSDLMQYRRHEVERIARIAFHLARSKKTTVTNVDKANVLATSQFWRSVVHEIHAQEFSDIPLKDLYVDNAAMQVLVRPQSFGVLLTGNLFGDILSDELAQISGSIGMQPSASLNADGFGLFEPMGGSAPDIAGKGIANPIAQIRCVQMMLENFQLLNESAAIDSAITKVLQNGIRTADIWLPGCQKVGTREMTNNILLALS